MLSCSIQPSGVSNTQLDCEYFAKGPLPFQYFLFQLFHCIALQDWVHANLPGAHNRIITMSVESKYIVFSPSVEGKTEGAHPTRLSPQVDPDTWGPKIYATSKSGWFVISYRRNDCHNPLRKEGLRISGAPCALQCMIGQVRKGSNGATGKRRRNEERNRSERVLATTVLYILWRGEDKIQE